MGGEFIFCKNLHTCKKVADKAKQGIATNVYATTRQVVEPIVMGHFEKDPERNLSVLDNVYRVV